MVMVSNSQYLTNAGKVREGRGVKTRCKRCRGTEGDYIQERRR
jgi:hypothetical protein